MASRRAMALSSISPRFPLPNCPVEDLFDRAVRFALGFVLFRFQLVLLLLQRALAIFEPALLFFQLALLVFEIPVAALHFRFRYLTRAHGTCEPRVLPAEAGMLAAQGRMLPAKLGVLLADARMLFRKLAMLLHRLLDVREHAGIGGDVTNAVALQRRPRL